MPKIDSLSVQWMGKFCKFECWFNKRQDFYIKACPTEVLTYVTSFTNSYKTLSDLKNSFRLALTEAEDIATKVESVILIKLNISSDTYAHETNQSRVQYNKLNGHPFNRFVSSMFSGDMTGIGFTITYRKAQRFITGDAVKYFNFGIESRHSMNGKMELQKGEIPVLYTKEKEDTLKTIQGNLIDMMYGLAKFFNADPETMSNILQSGNLQLGQVKSLK